MIHPNDCGPLLDMMLIVQPFPVENHLSVSVILNTPSPPLSFADLAFILQFMNIGIVASPVAHINGTNSESLVDDCIVFVE